MILEDYEKNKKKYMKGTFIIFAFALSVLIFIYTNFPHINFHKNGIHWIPQTPHELQILIDLFSKHARQHPWFFICAHIYCFIFMQCFSIPGHGLLSLIAGAIWGFKLGMILVCVSSTLGSVCSYFLSYTFLKGWIVKRFSDKI